METFHKAVIRFLLVLLFFAVIYLYNVNEVTLDLERSTSVTMAPVSDGASIPHYKTNTTVPVWCIFTKAAGNPPMRTKLTTFLKSLLQHSSAMISLNFVIDASSQRIAQEVVEVAKKATGRPAQTTYHEVTQFAKKLKRLIAVMQSHFSAKPGSYYSDSLYFLSLGLHKIAPVSQKYVLMIDIDTKVKSDIVKLYDLFDSFGNETLFGLCPEMSVVYRHAFNAYRSAHPNTTLGSPPGNGGFPGLNSGVLLLNLNQLRQSTRYEYLTSASYVASLCYKYQFRGHLGDQDFFTLLWYEHPELVNIVPCGWNYQLCTWWSDNGYKGVTPLYNYCKGPAHIYHGNCNTPIPVN